MLSKNTNPGKLKPGTKILAEGEIISAETEEEGKKIHSVKIAFETGTGLRVISFDLSHSENPTLKMLNEEEK